MLFQVNARINIFVCLSGKSLSLCLSLLVKLANQNLHRIALNFFSSGLAEFVSASGQVGLLQGRKRVCDGGGLLTKSVKL